MAVARWTFAVGSWESAPSHQLITARQRKVVFRSDDSAELGCVIDGRGHDAAMVDVLESDVWAYRDDELVFRGRVVAAPENADAERHVVSITATDYRGMLGRRYFQADVAFTATAEADIAWGLINHTQGQPGGDLGITRGTLPPGTTRDATYAAGDNIGDRLAELARVDNGFEWWVDATRVFRMAAPTRGEETNVVLDYGGSVAVVRREPDVGGFANHVTVTGGVGTTAERQAGDVTGDARGRWEGVFSFPAIVNQPALVSKAARLVDDGTRPPITYALTLAPGAWLTSAPVHIGDSALVRFISGQRRELVPVRIEELAVAIGESGEETVTLSAVALGAELAQVGGLTSTERIAERRPLVVVP